MALSKRAAPKRSAGRDFGARLHRELNNTRLTLLVALLFTVLVAAIFPTPAIRFMVALLAAGPFAGAAAARFFGTRVRASRVLPETACLGDTVVGRVELHNLASHPIFWVQAHIGEVPAPLGAVSRGEASPLQALDAELLVPLLRGGERLQLKAQWRANRRGVWHLPAVEAGASDPLGLSAYLVPRTVENTLVVLPRPVPLVRLGFLAGAAGARSPSRAAAVTEAIDFHGIRAWRAGEGVRRVHWKSTARTGQLHVIEWEEDLSGDVSVLLDVLATRGAPSGALDDALETAVTIAASVATHVLETGQRFELFCWIETSDGIQLLHHQARGANGLASTLRALAQVQVIAGDATDLAHLAMESASRVALDSGVLLLTAVGTNVGAANEYLAASGIAARRCTALLIERETPAKVRVLSGVLSNSKNSRNIETSNASTPHAAPGMRTRTLRAGTSIAALLEKDI